jgi:glucose-1-phosphate thymidylyltransferase
MLAGIKDILIITNPDDCGNFIKLLGDGSKFGINITYEVQYVQKGIADAFIIGEQFIGDDNVALILGDNIFHGYGFSKMSRKDRQGRLFSAIRLKTPKDLALLSLTKTKKLFRSKKNRKNRNQTMP